MRDPLHWMDVRRKLALTFIVVCLIAFGVGGAITSTSASRALESEIHARMGLQGRIWADALDAGMRLLTRRCEDFASDGYIRERIGDRGDADRVAALRRHLLVNKLPLVADFADLAVIDGDGEIVTTAAGDPPQAAAVAAALRGAGPVVWTSGVLVAGGDGTTPFHAISVPVRSLDGSRTAGRLVAWVRTDVWVRTAVADAIGERIDGADATDGAARLTLADRDGRRVVAWIRRGGSGPTVAEQVEVTAEAPAPAAPAARGSSEPPGTIDVVAPLASNGWTATVSVSSPESLGAVRSLQGRFLLVGVCLAAAIGVLLLFPMRFLVRPLAELGEAARRVQRGDLSVRVHPDAEDEIGDLGRSFNLMTEAVEERTRGLETAAAELREQRDRLDAVIANLRDGLVVLGADGTPVLSNAAAAPLLEMVAARDPRLAPREDCAKAGSHESCAECLGSRRGAARTCVIDAGDRVLEVHSTPLPAGPDGRSGRVLLARDITERVSAEARQIHQERLSVLGEAAAVMAHELNNPLAAIRLYAQMAGQGAASGADVREHLDVIVRNTQSCERAIRELLDYAHGSAPEFAEVDVRAVVEDAARFVRPLAERSRVSVALLPGPEPVVSGDEIQVRQVFVNLVMNAVQAMSGSGGGRIEVAISEDAGHAVVDVCDDGPGIPEAARGRVFEPFFTTKSRGQGTGLGLPTARRIAELHGGGVELVESRPGRTVFRVRIRRNAAAPVPGAAA